MAAGAVATAHRLGFEVPDHLTIVGFDDTAMASSVWPETDHRAPADFRHGVDERAPAARPDQGPPLRTSVRARARNPRLLADRAPGPRPSAAALRQPQASGVSDFVFHKYARRRIGT
ncbi:MAG: hypothetical protein WDN06_13240 [Asticcacaulis sp.]